LNEEEITLVKNHIAKGASDSELQFCLTVARRYKLDPFRGQIWFVKRNDKSAQGGERWIPIVGINGLLHVAARDHRDFGSIEEPEYGPMKKIDWTYYEKKGSINAPEWAKVTAWKKGFEHPIKATVYFEEIYPNVGASPMVRQMPRHMLGKCATAHVVRKAWPGTDGLYIREEFQGPQEFTENGRRIVYPETQESQPAILDANAPHGHEPGSEKAKQAEATLARVEAEDRRLAEERKVKSSGSKTTTQSVDGAYQPTAQTAAVNKTAEPKPSQAASIQQDKPRGTIELDLTIAHDPIIRGDISDLLEMIKKHCTATWQADSWWHILPKDVQTIHAMGQQCNYRVVEILPKQVSAGTSEEQAGKGAAKGKAGTPAGPAQTHAAPKTSDAKATSGTKTSAAPAASPSSEPQLVAGIIEQANPQSGKSPRLDVLLRMETSKVGVWMSTFDTKLFPHLTAGKGQQSELIVKKNVKGDKTYTNIVGLKRIGVKEFDEDGKAILSVHREPGTPNLFQP
jgi:hypothetical protein